MKVNFHLIQQPDQVESFIVPSINSTIKRVREWIAEQYDVDENAFLLYYQDNQVQTTKRNKSRQKITLSTVSLLLDLSLNTSCFNKGSWHVQHETTQR